jgi:dihydroorotate dehydrogenase
MASKHKVTRRGFLRTTGALAATTVLTARNHARAAGANSRFQMGVIGCGGIATADDAWERIRAGASLVQLDSAMVYEGPHVARHIANGLARKLERSPYATIAEAVGTE